MGFSIFETGFVSSGRVVVWHGCDASFGRVPVTQGETHMACGVGFAARRRRLRRRSLRRSDFFLFYWRSPCHRGHHGLLRPFYSLALRLEGAPFGREGDASSMQSVPSSLSGAVIIGVPQGTDRRLCRSQWPYSHLARSIGLGIVLLCLAAEWRRAIGSERVMIQAATYEQ